jgi:hypothetical protein
LLIKLTEQIAGDFKKFFGLRRIAAFGRQTLDPIAELTNAIFSDGDTRSAMNSRSAGIRHMDNSCKTTCTPYRVERQDAQDPR